MLNLGGIIYLDIKSDVFKGAIINIQKDFYRPNPWIPEEATSRKTYECVPANVRPVLGVYQAGFAPNILQDWRVGPSSKAGKIDAVANAVAALIALCLNLCMFAAEAAPTRLNNGQCRK